MRFHLDEHIDHAVATGLRQRGIDVTTTADAGLLGASDERQLEFARLNERVLLTQDADLLRLHQQGNPHRGIVFSPSGSRSVGELVRFLCLLHDCLEPDEMRDSVEFV